MFGLRTKSAPATKAVAPNADAYWPATITTGDTARTLYARNTDAIALAGLARGLVATCAHIVAEACAAQPMRLYKAGTINIRYERGRKVGTKAMRRLTDPARVGLKAAQWADTGGNVVEITDHPFLDLLNKPNDIQTGAEWAYQRFWWGGIAGEMFYYKVGTRGNLTQLIPMLPQFTQPMPADRNSGRLIDHYAYGRDRASIMEVDADVVWHVRNLPNPFDPYHGYGPLHACRVSAEVLAKNEDFDLELVDNGNIPPVFYSLDPTFFQTQTSVDDWMRRLRDLTRGVRGKVRGVAAPGLKALIPGGSAKDLQTAEKLDRHEARIRQAFGVPDSVLNMNDANLAVSQKGDEQFGGGTIRPILIRDASQINEMLLPEYGLEPGVYFVAYDDPVLEDTRQELEAAEILFRNGGLTVNELRGVGMLDAVEGGDRRYIAGLPLDANGEPTQQFGIGTSFGAPVSNDEEAETVVAPQKVEETALNGAQIAQLLTIAERVTTGVIGRPAALAMAQASFPGIPDDKLQAIFNQLVEGSAVAAAGEPKPEGQATPQDSEKRKTVPVVGRVNAKGNGDGANGCCASGGKNERMAVEDRRVGDGSAGTGHQQAFELVKALCPSVKLDPRHARPDPYAGDCGCGLRTKDDDDDKLSVRPVHIPPEVAARQTAALNAAASALAEVVEEFIEDAKAEALRQVLAGSPINLAEFEDQLAGNLEPAFREMFRAGFDFGGLELGEGTDLDPFSIPNAEAIEAAERSLIRDLSRDISDHTAQSIEGRIRSGIENGASIEDITKEIEGDTGFARYRAERIARTEVQNAAGAGKFARYKEAGVTKRYWVNAPGATPVHRVIASLYPDGQDMDKPFIKSGTTITAGNQSETYNRDIWWEPARPNCRCSTQVRPNDRDPDAEDA